ncbi:MAG: O-antigen ligase family protein [Bacteroidota bacterium]
MRKFLSDYISLITGFIVLVLLGNTIPFLGIGWGTILGLIYFFGRKDKELFLFLVVVLIMGDSRLWYLQYFKPLRIVLILMVFFRCLGLITSGKLKFRKVILYTIPFFIVAIAGGFLSPNIPLSMSKMISYFCLLFAVIHLVPYFLRQDNSDLIQSLIYISLLVLLFGLISSIVNPRFAYLVGRYRGVLGNPNGLGIYCTLMFPIIILGLELYPKQRGTFFIALFLMIFSLLLANSRTAIGSILIFYMLYWVQKRHSILRGGFYFFILPVGLLFLSSGGLLNVISLLGLNEYFRVESLTTGTGRYIAWAMGLEQIRLSPLIGRGFAWEEIYFHMDRIKEILIVTEHQGGMHNSYLTFLMNNGYLGLITFLIFLFVLFGKIDAQKYKLPVIITGVISSFFESWLNSSLNAFSIHFYILLMILIEYPRLKKKLLPDK